MPAPAGSHSVFLEGWLRFKAKPHAYITIPMVAAMVGFVTNWVGVKMLFYPIEYLGVEWYRAEDSPYGFFGWQGVVPTKTEKMATRLTKIVTEKLLSLKEAFSRVEPDRLAALLQPDIEEAIRREAPNGHVWAFVMRPFLYWALKGVVMELQREIEDVLDLRQVVLSAFMRDKIVLVDLFQKVGRVELDFLVNSGLWFGFLLGLLQMSIWAILPQNWTLPVAGAYVGYATNWIAIKLVFNPVEPVPIGPFVLQGIFEKRQPEVSIEFAEFLASRVLTSPRLIDEMTNGRWQDRFEALLRRSVPFVVPDSVVAAAAGGLRRLALEPTSHPTHAYIAERLDVQATLGHRLQLLSFSEFEDLLHPVFQEDEITLIIVGGVLGAAVGFVQQVFGWGGPAGAAVRIAASGAALGDRKSVV